MAAKKSQCPRQHESSWSVAIHHQTQLCKYWAGVVMKGVCNKTFRQSSMDIFQQLMTEMWSKILKVTQIHHPLITRLECYRQLQLYSKYQKQLLRTHRELGHQGLQSIKEPRMMKGNLEAAEIIRKIVQHELHNCKSTK
jgi:hypothetical protein